MLRLKEAEGDNLLRVVLFGSMARGDFDEESDTDVFVLLKEGTDIQLTERVCNIADDAATSISDCYVYISPFIETADSIAEEYKGISRWRFEPVFDAIREEACVLQNVTDPRHRRGVRHALPRGLVPGGGGGVGRQFDDVRGTPPI